MCVCVELLEPTEGFNPSCIAMSWRLTLISLQLLSIGEKFPQGCEGVESKCQLLKKITAADGEGFHPSFLQGGQFAKKREREKSL